MDNFSFQIFWYIILIEIIVTLYKIYKFKKNEKKRNYTEIIIIGKDYSRIFFACFHFALFLLLLVFLLVTLIPTYNKFNYLDEGYFSNVLQMFDLAHIDYLMDYFAKNAMALELLELNKYLRVLFGTSFMIIYSLCNAFISFYVGTKYITIFKEGILLSENLIEWKEFIDYKWSEPLEYRLFHKGEFYNLTLKAKSNCDIENNIKLKVKYEDKHYVQDILSNYIVIKEDELMLSFSPFPIIPTKRLHLRKIKSEDKNEIFYLKSNEEVLYYLDNPKHDNIEETEKYIDKINNGIIQNDWIQWGITLSGSEKVIGTICLWNISKESKTAEVGYDLMTEYQGKGIMQEALTAVVKYAFKIIKFNSLTAFTHKNNEKSINLLERNKFVFEREEGNNKLFRLNKEDALI
jgi:ribosomal-protein-alanine N-acetyltransferase